MKNLLFILLAGLFMVACGTSEEKTESAGEVTTENSLDVANEELLSIQFNVSGMTCTGCENTVKKSVTGLEGVSDVTASHTDSVAVVTFDKSQTSIDQISQAIESKGYEVAGYEIQAN